MTEPTAPAFSALTPSASTCPSLKDSGRTTSAGLEARLGCREEVNQLLKYDFSEVKNEEGQTMAEYRVVLAVITIAVFGALGLLSTNIVNAVTRVAGYIT